MTPRRWFRVHSFTGVFTGLLLFVICWSGTFATLAPEIDGLVIPGARVDTAGDEVAWARIFTSVQAAYPDSKVRWLEAPIHRWMAAQAVITTPAGNWRRVYLHPETGAVQGAHTYFTVWRFFRSFHRRLFLRPAGPGIYLVSAFALALGISLVSALMTYKRWWRRFFQFRPRRGRVLWSELHKVGGLWSLWFIALMAITGLWYGIERTSLLDRVWTPLPAHSPIAREAKAAPLPLASLVARARAARPDLRIRRIEPPGGRLGHAFRAEGQAGYLLVRDRVNDVVLDAGTGRVRTQRRGKDLTAYQRWVNTADPLHFGDFGGLASKLVWFGFGLVLSGLILTGTWLHADRLTRGAGGRDRHRWPGTLAALGVSLAVLALSVPFGLHEATTVYAADDGGGIESSGLAAGVQAVILGWIAATLALLGLWITLLWSRRQDAPRRSQSRDGRQRTASPASTTDSGGCSRAGPG